MTLFGHIRRAGGALAAAAITGGLAGPALAAESPPTPIAVEAALAHAAGARGVTYGGSTSADDPIVARLSPNGARIRQLGIQLEAPCTSGKTYPFVYGGPADIPVRATGRFRDRATESVAVDGGTADVALELAGRVVRRTLTGSATLHAEIRDPSGAVLDTCDQTVRVRASATRGRVYGGLTPQGRPVVLELTAGGRLVRHLHIGWRAPCTPDGTLTVGDTLTNFRISPTGRFGDDFRDTISNPEGTFTVAYSVRGRIGRATGRGSFRLLFTATDTAGSTTSCDTGRFSYRVTSG